MKKYYASILVVFVLGLVLCSMVELPLARGDAYGIVAEIYTEDSIQVNYPQIVNLGDADKQKMINELIKNRAFNYEEYPGLTVRTNYEIKWRSANLLTVQYKSYRYVKGAAHPVNVFSTINIDLNTGSEIMLNDLVVIDEDFLAKIRAGKFIAVSPRVKDIITFSDEELMRACNQEGNFYFSEDSLGIRVAVPHVAGDYVIFEVKYRDIDDNIKGENPVWREFIP